MEEYLEPVIELIARRTGIQLTEDQAQAIVDESGFKDEFIETKGESADDTMPRGALIECLSLKLANCEAPCLGDSQEYKDQFITKFVKGAIRENYNFVED